MKFLVALASGLALLVVVCGCGASEGTAPDTTSKLEKEMPKSTSKEPDMPSPGEGYVPKSGVPDDLKGGMPKK